MNQLTDALHIPDTQSERDERHLAIQRVGVKDVRYPLSVRVSGAVQQTAALWNLDVALPADQKGTHMSRFVAWLEEPTAPLDAPTLKDQLDRMLDKLHALEGRVESRFSFFIRKRAPVSGLQSLLDYAGAWLAERRDGHTALWAEVAVPVTIRVELKDPKGAPIEWHELVRFAEESASSEIWPMLKRADEKWITERAYENPKFVEALVRDVALRLNADARIGRYRVDVENFESIHNHSAWARIER